MERGCSFVREIKRLGVLFRFCAPEGAARRSGAELVGLRARHAGEWLDLDLLRERDTAKRLDVAFAPKVHALSLGRAAPLSMASCRFFDHAPRGSGMVAVGDKYPDARWARRR
jgi:hypothetical protein